MKIVSNINGKYGQVFHAEDIIPTGLLFGFNIILFKYNRSTFLCHKTVIPFRQNIDERSA